MKILTRIAVIFLLAAGVYFLREMNQQNPETKTVVSEIKTSPTEEKEPVILSFEEDKKIIDSIQKEKKQTVSVGTQKTYEKPAEEVPSVEIAEKVQAIHTITPVKVYLYEWGIDVSSETVPAGNIMFYVENNGKFSHEFAVVGKKNFGKVLPGEGAIFLAENMDAGNYVLSSPKKVDQQNGMLEYIVVE